MFVRKSILLWSPQCCFIFIALKWCEFTMKTSYSLICKNLDLSYKNVHSYFICAPWKRAKPIYWNFAE